MSDIKIEVPDDKKLTCEICNKTFQNMNSLGGHIGIGHKMLYEDYLVKYYNNNVRPPCAECGQKTRYDRRSGTFRKYCVEHSNKARSEWSKQNGYGVNQDPGWKRGLTKENSEIVRKHSEWMKTNNPMQKKVVNEE